MSEKTQMPQVTLFTRPQCHLCHAVQYVIARVAGDVPLEFRTVDIDSPGQERWQSLYKHDIPVIHINGREHARHRLDERAFRTALSAAGTHPPPDTRIE